MKLQLNLCGAALLVAASTMQAATVTMSLGQSTQNFLLTGLGALGSGNGTYTIGQGSCANAAGLTTCTLSGAITGSSNPAFASGSYQFITTYATADVMPIQGESQSPGSNSFFYDFLAPDVNMTLLLNGTPSGNVSEPLVVNGSFVGGTGFSFGYTATETCTGVATCTQANVGVVPGATISGPVVISASFTIPNVNGAPEPTSMALTGVSGLLAVGLWLRKRKAA